jgi:hypothetical protein
VDVIEVARQTQTYPDDSQLSPNMIFEVMEGDTWGEVGHLFGDAENCCSTTWITHATRSQGDVPPSSGMLNEGVWYHLP